MRAFSRRSAVFRCCLVLVLVVVGSAAAARAEDTTVEHPVMYFGFDPDPLSLLLCGNGSLRAAPSPNPFWTLDVYGVRSSGTLITGTVSTSEPTAFLCVTVKKQGAPIGTYTATFRYQALPTDPPAHIVAHIAWDPTTEGEIVATEQ